MNRFYRQITIDGKFLIKSLKMVKASKIIEKLISSINKPESSSNIEFCKELLSESFDEAVEEDSFYELPTDEIKDIFKKYIETSEEKDANVISKLIKRVSLNDPKEGFDMLRAVELEEPSFEECIKIISSASGCQICKQLGEQFAEKNYEFELQQKAKEIEELKKGNTSDVIVLFPNGEKKYFDLPKETTIGELKTLVMRDYNEPFPGDLTPFLRNNISILKNKTLISGEWRKTGNILNLGFKDEITINIKTLTGKYISFNCKKDEKIENIKEKIQDKEGIPPSEQRLFYEGIHLENEYCLKDYGLFDDAKIQLSLRLRG